jgi:hypothetical protein
VRRLGRREKKNERASKVFEEVRKKDGEEKVSVKLLAFIVITGLAIFGYSEAWGFDWKYYGTNEEGTYFCETETMTHLSQNIVRVCVQSIYTEKGISHWVKEGGKEFQELDFSLILSEFNCVEKSIRHLRIVFYSKNGEIFYPIKNEEWHFFAPDSMSGTLFNEICK